MFKLKVGSKSFFRYQKYHSTQILEKFGVFVSTQYAMCIIIIPHSIFLHLQTLLN
jgi:hypothetical protein